MTISTQLGVLSLKFQRKALYFGLCCDLEVRYTSSKLLSFLKIFLFTLSSSVKTSFFFFW